VYTSRSFADRLRLTQRSVLPSLLLLAQVLLCCFRAQCQESSVKTVFVIAMSGKSWSSIGGNSSAAYINGILLSNAAFASAYFALPGRPMEADYFWLEAGTDFGITLNAPPNINHQDTTNHLVSLLERAGISWKTYQEGIDGSKCPLTDTGIYTTKSNPFVFFDDVTNNLSSQSSRCIGHVRPYTEFATDLGNNNVGRYNFIRPGLCNSMFQSCAGGDSISQGDKWLSQEVPKILASSVYNDGGALFIIWDHGDGNDSPVGMILLSPFAKKKYTSAVRYTHASTLRTIQEIFGVTPLLGDAANQTSLAELFSMSGGNSLSATLTWTASPGATSYNVKRGTSSGGPFVTVASGIISTSYVDGSVLPGTTYFYVLSGVNSNGESPQSAPVSLTLGSPPPAPTNVSVKQTPPQ